MVILCSIEASSQNRRFKEVRRTLSKNLSTEIVDKNIGIGLVENAAI